MFCRYQIWPLDKKIRVARQAKDYLKRHASEVEQRLAQDRTFNAKAKTAKLKFIKWMQVMTFDIQFIEDLEYDILLMYTVTNDYIMGITFVFRFSVTLLYFSVSSERKALANQY